MLAFLILTSITYSKD